MIIQDGARTVAHDLTWDQKPDGKGEMERIQKAGGIVTAPEVMRRSILVAPPCYARTQRDTHTERERR